MNSLKGRGVFRASVKSVPSPCKALDPPCVTLPAASKPYVHPTKKKVAALIME